MRDIWRWRLFTLYILRIRHTTGKRRLCFRWTQLPATPHSKVILKNVGQLLGARHLQLYSLFSIHFLSCSPFVFGSTSRAAGEVFGGWLFVNWFSHLSLDLPVKRTRPVESMAAPPRPLCSRCHQSSTTTGRMVEGDSAAGKHGGRKERSRILGLLHLPTCAMNVLDYNRLGPSPGWILGELGTLASGGSTAKLARRSAVRR